MNERTTGDGGGGPKPTRGSEEPRVPSGESVHGQQRPAESGPNLGETAAPPGTGSADMTRSLTEDATIEARPSGGNPAIGGKQGRVPALGVWSHLELIEKVGEGGFGETFRARDPNLDREVALKLLKVEASRQEALGGQVIREGALLARVRHPNVVSVYGAQAHDGRVGLWMEYIKGRTLESQLTEQGLGEREAALVGVDLCRALAAVHGAGIIHRDIKAANVMREDGGRLVLMDFGLGLDLKREEAGAAGPMAGTPFYMAPEQLRGEPATVRSDIYSVGVLLYRLVTGRYPLTGRTLAELREGHDSGRAVRLRDVRADLSTEFVRVVERCLEREPQRRIETPGALEAALMNTLGAAGSRETDREHARSGETAELLSADLLEFRKGRIAEWSQPRYNLDKEFVALTLLVDQGEESAAGRWSARPERYRDLGALLEAVEDRALVLLGPPGSGKSTLLRRFELEVAQAALAHGVDRESPTTERPRATGDLADSGGTQDRSSLPGRGEAPKRGGTQDGPWLPGRGEASGTGGAPAIGGDAHPVTFFIQLNYYKPARPGEPPPEPGAWLAERWAARFPDLPPLPALLDAGRMVLLLDGLNEMGAAGPGGAREGVTRWKEFLDRLVAERPGNRVVFSCRTLDYSAPLSTASLRVPQVVIEPMTDAQVEQYLLKHAASSAGEGFEGGDSTGATAATAGRGAEIWSQLKGTPQLEVMRSPYFLSLLVEQADAAGGIPRGRAGLFTGFVRRTLRREVERDNPLFAPDGLLTERDVRRIAQGKWSSPWELPERGVLIPKLSELAFGMQAQSAEGGSSQVRVGYDEALDLLDHDHDEKIVKAGEALSVLDEDTGQDEVKFFHQLIQEYFAGRRFAASPEPERVRTSWKSAEITPPLAEVLRALPLAETLPPLATTGWEETGLAAGAMSADPDGFVRGLMKTNLALAGRCASQSEVLPKLSPGLLEDLRGRLVERSRDRVADLRSRIETGLALGPLGDPRFERRKGPYGDYLLPPLAEIPAGRYPIGEDEPFEYMGDTFTDHMPRHEVEIAAFRIGRFPVTNAEWALFMDAGGYEDERWWDTPAAQSWQSGEGTAEGVHANVRYFLGRFRKDPEEVERRWQVGELTEALCERWKKRLAMTEGEFEAHLRELYPGGKLGEPAFWHDATWNNFSQPAVGVCWFEARAYTLWLSAQAGEVFRLPTEAEWEAAARGREARLYAYGNEFDPLKGNTSETRIRRTTPVGVFVEGDTPEEVSDLTGNVDEWTASLFGAGGPNEPPTFGYPYRPGDGREDPSAGPDVRRVLRGGAWNAAHVDARAAGRHVIPPDDRGSASGFRLVAAVASPISI